MNKSENENNGMLHLAEILYDNGNIKFRYSRRMSPDGKYWIRHGLFVAYHENGSRATEGHYEDGIEVGIWRDFYENGQTAAEGCYAEGREDGIWRFWKSDGKEEPSVTYCKGQVIASE